MIFHINMLISTSLLRILDERERVQVRALTDQVTYRDLGSRQIQKYMQQIAYIGMIWVHMSFF